MLTFLRYLNIPALVFGGRGGHGARGGHHGGDGSGCAGSAGDDKFKEASLGVGLLRFLCLR